MRRLLVGSILDGKAGHNFYVKADRYVLAAGGIETVRLLLVSNSLGNHSDTLGRYFMVHPVSQPAGTFVSGMDPGESVRSFYAGVKLNKVGFEPRIFGVLMPTSDALKRLKIGNFRARFHGWNSFDISWEQVPNPDSRITLNGQRDPVFGDPQIRLDWRPTLLDIRTLQEAVRLVLDELTAVGYATDPTRSTMITSLGEHHIGATRMSTSPFTGVVDADCRVHGVDNLYVASSSVFPTCGFANPTLTIIALAIRDHVRSSRLRMRGSQVVRQ